MVKWEIGTSGSIFFFSVGHSLHMMFKKKKKRDVLMSKLTVKSESYGWVVITYFKVIDFLFSPFWHLLKH